MKKIYRRLSDMTPQAGRILSRGLCLACGLLVITLLLLFKADGYTIDTYLWYKYARTVNELTFTVMFLTVVLSAFIEEQLCKRL